MVQSDRGGGKTAAEAGEPIERWSMDFVHDTLADGLAFRILTVVDNWSRSNPVLGSRFRISGALVSQVLDHVLGESQRPRSITGRSWGRNSSRVLSRIGRIGGASSSTSFDPSNEWKMCLRDECLNMHQFASLAEA